MRTKKIVIWILIIFLSIGALYFFWTKGLSALLGFLVREDVKMITNKPGLKTLPCNPASQVELGYPSLLGHKIAEFTTTGGSIYIKPRQYDSTGGFELPHSRTTGIVVGLAANPPVIDDQRNIVTNTLEKIEFNNGDYGELKLEAGRYWLGSSGEGYDIVLYGCDLNGVSDPIPVK